MTFPTLRRTSELQSHVHTTLSKMWSLQKKRARIVSFMWRGEENIILPLWYFPLKVDSVAGFRLMATFLTPPQAPFWSQNQRNCIIKWQSMSTKRQPEARGPQRAGALWWKCHRCVYSQNTLLLGTLGREFCLRHPRLTQDNSNVWKMAPSLHSTHRWSTCQHGGSFVGSLVGFTTGGSTME